MAARAWIGTAALLAAAALGGHHPAAAQEGRRELARELARITVDEASRRRVDEQVGMSLAQAIGVTLQERLGRRLIEVEWGLIAGIVRRFVSETLTPGRAEEIAAEAYARHFEESELREVLQFQRSATGRKAARLSPVLAAETLQAIEGEIRRSPAMPRMVEELQREFPVLRSPESP